MSTYYFDITEEKVNSMTVEHYEALERMRDGEGKLYLLRPVLCHFMTDESGKPIPEQTALAITKKFNMKEMAEFVKQFYQAFEFKAVPKASGSPSPSPTEVKQVDSVSQHG